MPRPTRTRCIPVTAASAAVAALALGATLPSPVAAQQAGKKATSGAKPAAPPAGKGAPQVIGMAEVSPSPSLLLFNKAIAATDAKKYAEAERLYRKLLKDDPSVAAAWANLGLLLGTPARGDYAGAIRCLEKATKLGPDTAAYWAQLSAMQLRAGRWKATEASAKRALALEPKNLLALADLADAQMQQRHYADAVVTLRKLREVEGGSGGPRTEVTLVMALAASGKRDEALALARKRVDRNPKDVEARLLLGDAARMAGKLDEAKRAYEAAQRLAPKNPAAANGIAVVAAAGGDREAALKLLDQRLDKTPDDPNLQFQRGFLSYSDTNMAEAERCKLAEPYFKRASLLSPKNPAFITYYGLSVMFQGRDRYDEAGRLLNAALSLEPKFTFARLALASLAERQNQVEMAGEQYKAILAYAPNEVSARRGMAGIHYASGRKAEAYQEMDRAADVAKTDTQLLAELGSWQTADGALPAAQKTYEKLLGRAPRDAGAHLALGQIHERLAKTDAARQEYAAALESEPKNTAAALALGELLTTLKQPDAAIEAYRKLLAANPADNQVRWQLAHALQDQKKFDESLAEMRKITLRKEDPNRLQYILGAPRLLMAQKRAAEAIPLLQQTLQEEPQQDEVRYALADAYEQAGRFEDAERLLIDLRNRPAAPDPKQAQAQPGAPKPPTESVKPYLALAGLYERAKRPEDAARNYEEALRVDPAQRPALLALSTVREKQGKPGAAAEYLEKVITADPDAPNLTAVGTLRQYHVGAHTFPEYLAFSKRLLAKYPENRVAQYVRARAVTDENPDEAARREAVGLYERILEKAPNDQESRLQVGLQYEALGRKEDAAAAFRTVLNLNPANAEAAAALKRVGSKSEAAAPAAGKGK